MWVFLRMFWRFQACFLQKLEEKRANSADFQRKWCRFVDRWARNQRKTQRLVRTNAKNCERSNFYEIFRRFLKFFDNFPINLFKIREKTETRCQIVDFSEESLEKLQKILAQTRVFIDCEDFVENSLVFKDIGGQNIELSRTEQGKILVFYRKFIKKS